MVVVFKYDSGLLPHYSSVTMDATAHDGSAPAADQNEFPKKLSLPAVPRRCPEAEVHHKITELGSEPNRFISVITELKNRHFHYFRKNVDRSTMGGRSSVFWPADISTFSSTNIGTSARSARAMPSLGRQSRYSSW